MAIETENSFSEIPHDHLLSDIIRAAEKMAENPDDCADFLRVSKEYANQAMAAIRRRVESIP
jgi:hypothetical protein